MAAILKISEIDMTL